jgi:PEGA domain
MRAPPVVVVLVLALMLVTASCAHLSAPAGVDLRVDTNVPESTIWVDDVLVGTASAWAREGRHLRAGFHRLEIRAAGYYSVFQEVDQPDGGHATVKATLRPLLE